MVGYDEQVDVHVLADGGATIDVVAYVGVGMLLVVVVGEGGDVVESFVGVDLTGVLLNRRVANVVRADD